MQSHRSESSLPFIQGTPPAAPGPLARFLPPLPDGVAPTWLAAHLPVGEVNSPAPWVLDPFGAAPRLAIEIARSGYRVLVAANNPVARFLIEMAADPPEEAELQAALAELASASRGDDRIEPHIRSLYQTECIQCGQPTMAEAFLWERQADAPYARVFTCSRCGTSGEFPVTQQDVLRARQFTTGGLHRARALERVAPPNDPDRIHAEEAISVYLPRAVYALFTLINKLDGLPLSQIRRKHLTALLLYACDLGNTLWQVPSARERPRQLTIPPRFRENNLWMALEKGIKTWTSKDPPVPLAVWPNLPPERGGICLFEGRLHDLYDQLRKQRDRQVNIGMVLTALPRPNQAFWTLSALWSGWLWGRESVGPFKNVLRRRRYDWAWHTAGLYAAFNNLEELIQPDTLIFGMIGEAEPGFLASALVATDLAGFNLHGISLRGGTEQAQIQWKPATRAQDQSRSAEENEKLLREAANRAAQEFLQGYGQPATFLRMHTAALEGILREGVLRATRQSHPEPQAGQPTTTVADELELSPADHFTHVQNVIREVLSYRGGYLRFGASDSPDTGYWWLRDPEHSLSPQSDRIEKKLVNSLVRDSEIQFSKLLQALFDNFPGLYTPNSEIVQVCLDSYALQDSVESDIWRLRPQDTPAARKVDLENVSTQLRQLAERLGYAAEGHSPLRWIDKSGDTRYWFYPIASAVIGDILLGTAQTTPSPAAQSLIVLPGSRANLVAYKLRHDPRLRNLCVTEEPGTIEANERIGWRFIKFRHVRWLLDNLLLKHDNLDDLINVDPLTYSAPQMRLF